MIYLSEKEVEIYNLLVTGLRASEVAKITGYHTSSLHSIIKRLIGLRIIEKQADRSYKSGKQPFETIKDDTKLTKCRKLKTIQEKRQMNEPFSEIQISEEQMKILISLYKKMKRSSLALMFGVPKYVVNREIMNLEEKGVITDGNTAHKTTNEIF